MTSSEMSETPSRAEYAPKSYRNRMSMYWWLQKWSYFKFMLRELSSVFVAWCVVITLLEVRAVSRGPQAYAEFQNWLARPLLLTLNAVSFFFVLLHTVTWFNLTPRAMAVRVRGRRLPSYLITAANYAAWLAISGIVAWFFLRG